MREIVILGAGDFAKEIAWLIEDINKKEPTYIVLGFLDDDDEKIGKCFNGYECIGSIDYLSELNKEHHASAVIASQDGKIRKRIVEMFPEFHEWEMLVHPSVNISKTSQIGKGSIVCAGSNISCDTIVGDFCVLNISSIIGNDCIIGNYVSVMSGSCVSGHVQVDEGAYLATNSTIVPGISIGAHAKVGAGSVVIRNVKNNTSVMGVPAKTIRF